MLQKNAIRKATALAVFVLALLLIYQPAVAQNTYYEYTLDDSILVIGERVGKTTRQSSIGVKLPLNIRATPASIGVVTSDLINEQNNTTLGDALRNVSGVNAQSGFGVFDYFIIRGFNSLENGLVLTDGTFEPEVMMYDLYNIDRVEALKGPGAFLYGGNPLSGTINLVRKQPIFRNFTNVASSYGSFNSYRGSVDAGFVNQTSRFSGRFNGLWQAGDGYRDAKDSKVYAVNPTFSWRLNNRNTLHANVEYVYSELSPDAGIPMLLNANSGTFTSVFNTDAKTSFQPDSDVSEQQMLRFKVDFRSRLNNVVSIRNKLYYTNLDWQSQSTLLGGAVTDQFLGTIVPRSSSTLDDRQWVIGNQLELIANIEAGGVLHNFLGGVEVSQLSDNFRVSFENASLVLADNPLVEIQTGAEGAPQFLTDGDGSSRVIAPYFVDRISLSTLAQVFIGGRFDMINYTDDRLDFVETFSNTTGYRAEFISSETDRSYNEFSPMAGVVLHPTNTTSIYGNYGRAFAAPSSQTPGDLEAEESVQFEAGLKNSFANGKVDLNLAYYDIERRNIALPSTSGISSTVGSQQSAGVEVDLTVRPAKGLVALVSWAFNESELTEFKEVLFAPNPDPMPGLEKFGIEFDHSGNVTPFAPKHLLNFWVSKEFDSGLGLAAGGLCTTQQFIAPDNAYAIDDKVTFDGAVFYTVNQWSLRLNLKNITNQEYFTRGFSSTAVIPANPFSIVGSIKVSM